MQTSRLPWCADVRTVCSFMGFMALMVFVLDRRESHWIFYVGNVAFLKNIH